MKIRMISADWVLTIGALAAVAYAFVAWPWWMLAALVLAVANMIIGIGIVTMLDQRVDGELTRWLTDLPVQWLAAVVIACWPVLMWTHRKSALPVKN